MYVKYSMWLGEVCKRCNKRNCVGYILNNELWEKITENKYSILCLFCLDELAQVKLIDYIDKNNIFIVNWRDFYENSYK